MAEEKEPEAEKTNTWGTLEELLLACAVKRHGFKDWNSVAMEVQARSCLPRHLITARNCELKFHDLKRRFVTSKNDAVLNLDGKCVKSGDKVDNIPWLDELRKLRVAELRQEVHLRDVSIHSLQLKVKRLEDEREGGLKNREAASGKPDLKTQSRELGSESDKKIYGGPDRSEPKLTDAKVVVSGENSDREDMSVNQSNSTGSKSSGDNDNAKSESKPEFASGSYRPERTGRESEPIGPHSDDGSTDTVVKNPTLDILVTKPKKEKPEDNSSELADSGAAESHGDTRTRESSEVQSSASLTGKMKRMSKRKRKRLIGKEISGGSSGNGPDRTETVKSRQFEVLQIIRAHKHGSLFESRLKSQETEEYRRIVRQHLDLETVEAKLNSGSYSSTSPSPSPSSLTFYKDLLLICNNAVTFFPQSSHESIAAHELRCLISNEMKKSQLLDPSLEPMDSSPAITSQSKDPDLERSDSLPTATQKSSAPIIVCRKRSSISAKLLNSLSDKGDQSNDDEKSAINLKIPTIKSASRNAAEDHDSTKEVKEKPVTGARSLRRGGDGLTNSGGSTVKKQNTSAGWKPNSGNKMETPKTEKKKPNAVVGLEKKRGAADFLKRIKQNLPAETSKRNIRGGNGGGGSSSGNAVALQKKGSGDGKGDKGKERVLRQNNNDKRSQKEDSGSPSKRSVGRPPKRMVAEDSVSTKKLATPVETNSVSTKRMAAAVETNHVSTKRSPAAVADGGKETPKRPRKRPRRRSTKRSPAAVADGGKETPKRPRKRPRR